MKRMGMAIMAGLLLAQLSCDKKAQFGDLGNYT